MNQFVPLELQLWDQLDEAASDPEAADLQQLWANLDATIAPMDTQSQLRVVADAIALLAQLVRDRSVLTFEEIQAVFNHVGPIMPENAFERYVRQSMQVDLAQFIQPPPSLPRKTPPSNQNQFENDGRSVAVVLDKEALLQALESQEQASELDEAAMRQKILDIAYVEDVDAWVRIISDCLSQQRLDSVSLTQLRQALSMPVIEIWLGLLLGGYSIRQDYSVGEPRYLRECQKSERFNDWFYVGEIWIDCFQTKLA